MRCWPSAGRRPAVPHPFPNDPGMRDFIALNDRFFPADAIALPMADQRARYDAYCEALMAPLPVDVSFHDIHIRAQNPERLVRLRRYAPASIATPGVTILYMHGGGFIVGGLESHHDICAELARAAGVELVSVDYRLAPEHIHPAQIDDTLAAYEHLVSLGRRVVVGGDSAGGNLATALCLRCKLGAMPAPVGQFLIYPGLGGDDTRGSYVEMGDAPLLTTADVRYYFDVHSGGADREACTDPDLTPLKARDFSGLPPAAIVSADIDPLRDDGRDYCAALTRAGVQAVWRNEPELLHGYLRARTMSAQAGASFAWICEMAGRLARQEPLV
jgi:acetyl esterase